MELLNGKDKQAICYPHCTLEDVEQRICELRELGIELIEFTGKNHIKGLAVVGKGCVGIVVVAYRHGKQVALKTRRTDASRSTMHHEASMLEKANTVNVGPTFLGETQNCLLMEYVEGSLLPEWLKKHDQRNNKKKVQHVLHSIMEQARRLDKAGLDHGELSNGSKHIIVKSDNVPVILDFESGSVSRRVSNVTSVSNFLFVGSSVAKIVEKILESIDRDHLMEALKIYKGSKTSTNFAEILRRCRL
ncbi:MAG: protein kinase [Candidatus Bathyarchaeota archaeon]|nr:protein kinase [Candidatus Bathyarchaeota archaeon]